MNLWDSDHLTLAISYVDYFKYLYSCSALTIVFAKFIWYYYYVIEQLCNLKIGYYLMLLFLTIVLNAHTVLKTPQSRQLKNKKLVTGQLNVFVLLFIKPTSVINTQISLELLDTVIVLTDTRS